MNLNCLICTDLLNPTDNVCANVCGHIYHYACILQWLERSKSCPQCRYICSAKSIHKIYFNVANLDTSNVDVACIQQQLDDMKLALVEKEKELHQANEDIESLKSSRKKSMKTISGLTKELSEKNFLVASYDEQLRHLKADNKAIEELRKENEKLKAKNDLMTTVQNVLTSTSTDVEDMLKNEKNTETLIILIGALKRELRICEKRKNELRDTLKSAQNDLRNEQKNKINLKERISYLESVNYRLKESVKSSNAELIDLSCNESSDEILNKLTQASTVKTRLLKGHNSTLSPNITEKAKGVEDANSPYFNIKSSSIGLGRLLKNNELDRNKETHSNGETSASLIKKTTSDLSEKYSIFKKPRLDIELNKLNSHKANTAFNGMGGTEKNDDFFNFTNRFHTCDLKLKSSLDQRLKSGKLKKLPVSSNKTSLDNFLTKKS